MGDGRANAMKSEVRNEEKGRKIGFVGAKNLHTGRISRGVGDAVLGREVGGPEDGWEGFKWAMRDGGAAAMLR